MRDQSRLNRKNILSAIREGRLSAKEGMKLLVAASAVSQRAAGEGSPEPALPPAGEHDGPASPQHLRRALEAWLARIVAAEAEIPVARVEPAEPLERYGFDSVMALSVLRALEKEFGKLSPTLLFEHQTVAALAEHLSVKHRAVSLRLVAANEPAAEREPPVNEPPMHEPLVNAPARAAQPFVSEIAPGTAHAFGEGAQQPAAELVESDVAIVGLSCRFPLAENLDEFWENLSAGKDCITEIPRERWDHDSYFDPEKGKPGKSYSKWGGFLRDVDKFDAAFFHISPREAERIDPQERLFLEEVWHALEDAGIPRQRLWGRAVGVYVGVMYSQYQLYGVQEALQGHPLTLGSSYASIANRVSYFFNLHGPSMAVDTMCSSSLATIHLACEALRRKEIDVAIAGGVNVTIHPKKYLDLSEGRYAASDGRCRSFGLGGDGYVPGEGVGVAILKPLGAALANGDRIHAVIRGSALGHGGKTNGYTVPNPKEQSRIIEEACRRARIRPRALSYIEAHGTGTSLGDPIEIDALIRAFRDATPDVGFCAVGSVKSNIGHLESAAGIAGLAKVVLQMRHGQVAPSLHADTLNPHLELEGTPFYIQRSLSPWQTRPESDASGAQLPRRMAGISSFGAGGSNAHLIVEEPPPRELPAQAERGPSQHLILLSAQTDERLRVYARSIADHVARGDFDDVSENGFLAALAHTLRSGRETLDERFALKVTRRDELVRRLRDFAETGAADGVLRGSRDHSHGELEPLRAGESVEELVERGDLNRLAILWLQGTQIEWEGLDPGPVEKISLPGYPFIRERHWAPTSTPAPANPEGGGGTLHPLVHRNVSTLKELRYATRLTGSEPVVRDHRVGGALLLPAAAMIEMARASGVLAKLAEQVRVEDLVWESPLVVDPAAGCEVSVQLSPEGDDAAFTVWSGRDLEHAHTHARGRLIGAPGAAMPEGRLDVAALLATCGEPVDRKTCYRLLAERGLSYGPELRALEWLRPGDGAALGMLRLPAGGRRDRAAFVLPPALLDGAFQSLLAFDLAGAGPTRIPFALERVEIVSPLPDTCLVYTVARGSSSGSDTRPQVFDLTLAGEDGQIVARMSGLVVRPMLHAATAPRREPDIGSVILGEVWRQVELTHPVTDLAAGLASGGSAPRGLLVFETRESWNRSLANVMQRRLPDTEIVRIRPGERFCQLGARDYEIDPADAQGYVRLLEAVQGCPFEGIVHAWSQHSSGDGVSVSSQGLQLGFHSLLALGRALIQRAHGNRLRWFYAHPAAIAGGTPMFAAVRAFLDTLVSEYPSYSFTTLEVPAADDGTCSWNGTALDRLLAEISVAGRGNEEVRYGNGARWVRVLEVQPAEQSAPHPSKLRHEGVYLLTGGLGGLGRALARHLARHRRARLVLSGRSPLDEGGAAFLQELEAYGGQAVYLACDCASDEGARRLVEEAKQRFGRLDGVAHLAGSLRDGLIVRKTREDAEAVLRPKVWGAYHLDLATRHEPLDFFAIFSSASAVMGIAGQSDYAYANAFLQCFAEWRERQVRSGERSGRTVSVAWPLWQAGGMGVDAAARVWIEENLGWIPLPQEEGLRIFESSLDGGETRCAVFHGHRTKILEVLGLAAKPQVAKHRDDRPEDPPTRVASEANAAPKADAKAFQAYLRDVVSAELKLPVERLDPAARFERLGLESVMVMNITRKLETVLGELSKTLFFEHKTLNELSDRLLESHAEAVAAGFPLVQPQQVAPSSAAKPQASIQPSPVSGEAARPLAHQLTRRALGASRHRASALFDQPIAIVGLAGRYPEADSMEELWANLQHGRDCITEIPAERWDHSLYFDPAGGAGKSYSKWGGFLREVDRFDPRFFRLSPREVRTMDPQERLFLEIAWETLEDAGYTPEGLSGERVGVFVGVMYAEYQLHGTSPEMQRQDFVPGSLSASVANRVSYLCDFNGPSLALNTMCSSSLTALHLACNSIRLGDCDVALAGGVNTILHPNRYLLLSQGKFASSDGRCRSFGEGGDGYVPGEGVGAVLLKPLGRALSDGDHIYAVVRGTSVNHGGRTNGYTVPSPVSQGEVIRRAIESAGVEPGDIGYVEAHGTGTSLGDPIEIDGLARAFTGDASKRLTQPCPIGSVKSNIGHLESTAGIAGVTKVLLQMKHRMLVPSLHSERLNPNIQFKNSPFFVQRTLEPWVAPGPAGAPRPRIAAVSSFGAGGSNAHVILEEGPALQATARGQDDASRELVLLSARSEAQLLELATALAERVAPSAAESVSASPRLLPRDGKRAGRALSDGQLAGVLGAAAAVLDVMVEDVEPDEELESLGFDAVAMEALAERLRRAHDADLTSDELGRCRSLRQIAELVAGRSDVVSTRQPVPAASYDLRDVAYTLRVGRQAHRERLALVAGSLEDLGTKLRRFCAGELVPDLFRNRVGADADPWATLLEGEEGAAYLRAIRQSGNLTKLARMWVAGVDVGAAMPSVETGARRVSLPTYPFARERYWLPETQEGVGQADRRSGALESGESGEAPVAAEAPAKPVRRPVASPAPDTEPMAPLAVAPAAIASPDIQRTDSPRARRDAARAVIVEAMTGVLEIPATEFDDDTPHSDFGIDSVLAVEIVDRINSRLNTELKPTDFFNYTTIRKLVDHVVASSSMQIPVAEPTAPESRGPALQPEEPAHAEAHAAVVSPSPSPSPSPMRRAADVAPTDVAVIGMSGRFQDARNLDELWANLAAGRDSIREVPPARWSAQENWDPDPMAPGKTYSKWGSFLDEIDQFDPDFFGISPREARLMDPQQRLFLMEAWRALEDAGYSDQSLDGLDCQTLVGTAMGDYHHLLQARGVAREGYTFMGTHPAVLSSRIAYHLNLRGLSMAVDTSCSSSLMAVHLACEALRAGQCDLAVAGGVAVLVTPELHILASKARMLSPRGRCRAFDDSADGFVPGEGVGALVLKRLDQALRDGDHIHGVIAGTGANQDGKTNGLTAPSAPSQSALERAVYKRFGIDPEQISYVECHGTGTRLGDPIEIEALTSTFREFTDRRGYCAIGSIKTNLGHTLTAAGIAGLFKVLLSLRNRQLAPSLHVETPNRYIPFAESPFFVNTKLRDWTTEPGVPRLAAVSSFGFSGTNVHALLREAPVAPPRPREEPDQWRLIPVSAKTESALEDRLDELHRWLQVEGSRAQWRDIAYTLGVGRSHFPVRAAFLARRPAELLEKIAQRHQDAPLSTGESPDLGRLIALANTFRAGGKIDWEALYHGEPCHRISLPTYPFARESYWVPDAGGGPPTRPLRPGTRGGDQVFRHRIAADDPVVRDHVIAGKPLLPAAGHLAFVHQDLQEIIGDTPATLSHAVWLRPLFVTEDRDIEVAFKPDGAERFTYEVRSTSAAGSVEVHSRGRARIGAAGGDPIDLDDVRGRCPGYVGRDDLYDRFTRSDMLYGEHFATVQEIRHSDVEALATLTHRGSGPILPAGVLDGALQSVAALHPESAGQRPPVPFAMDEIRLIRPVPQDSFVYVRQTKPGECHLAIVDSRGRPCILIDGLSSRELKEPVTTRLYVPEWSEVAHPGGGASGARRVLIVAQPGDRSLSKLLTDCHSGAEVHTVRLDPGGGPAALAGQLDAFELPDRVYFLGGLDDSDGAEWSKDDIELLLSTAAVQRSQELGVRSLFRLAKVLIAQGASQRRMELIVVTGGVHGVAPGDRLRPFAGSLAGFAKSLAKEQPSWQVTCLDVDLAELASAPAKVASAVAASPVANSGEEVVLRGEKRWIQALRPAEIPRATRTPFRYRGTYLILGGAGGIGSELALQLARRVQARIVLVGRRARTAEIEERLRAMEAAGGSAIYCQADVTDPRAMAAAVAAAKERFGCLHGVFHSALVLRDALIERMDEDALNMTLAPKVAGAVELVRAVRHEPLDFLVFFSSAQSFSCNAGQANYAAACTFKDALARSLGHAGLPVHIVNWGYWGEVGVVAKAAYRRRMESLGVHSIGIEEGMEALETIIARGIPQAMPLKAESRVLQAFGVQQDAGVIQVTESSVPWNPLGGVDLPPPPDIGLLKHAHAELDGLGVQLFVQAVQQMGAWGGAGERFTSTDLAQRLSIAPSQRGLWETLLGVAASAGYLYRDGDWWRTAADVERVMGEDLAAERRRLAEEHPEVAAHVELLWTALEAYPRLLRGEATPAEILFPGSSMEKVEAVYRGDPLADRLNELAARAVDAFVGSRSPHERLRVLEIGAGTGGTTARVLERLAPHRDRLEYLYTDVSNGFLRHGRKHFGHHGGHLSFRRLDIERDVVEQGFEKGTFDVVVAANVLHATRNLRETASNVASLLRDQGWLVLVEATAFSTFLTLTFGLLEGWWRWEDTDMRIAGSPLAAPSMWNRLLRETGFGRTTILTPGNGPADDIGQHVVIAGRQPGATIGRPSPAQRTRTTTPIAVVAQAAAPVPSSRPAEDAVRAVPAPAAPPRNGTRPNRAALQDLLARSVAEILGRSEVDLVPDRLFTEYGVDSIILVDLINVLNARLGLELKPTVLFDHPHLTALTDFLLREHGEAIQRALTPASLEPPSEPSEPSELDWLRQVADGNLSIDDAIEKLRFPHE